LAYTVLNFLLLLPCLSFLLYKQYTFSLFPCNFLMYLTIHPYCMLLLSQTDILLQPLTAMFFNNLHFDIWYLGEFFFLQNVTAEDNSCKHVKYSFV
jgi:hypothetical protein